jgi:hypothetical protein
LDSSRLRNSPTICVAASVGASMPHTAAAATPSSWWRRTRSSAVGSSPAMPEKYHLMRSSPWVASSTSRPKARAWRAQAVPSGAEVAMRSVRGSACAASGRAASAPPSTSVHKARVAPPRLIAPAAASG